MAPVYLAHDVRHDRKVALKLLRPELSAILGGTRFLLVRQGAGDPSGDLVVVQNFIRELPAAMAPGGNPR